MKSLIPQLLELSRRLHLGDLEIASASAEGESEMTFSDFSLSDLKDKLLEITALKAKLRHEEFSQSKVTGMDISFYPALFKAALGLFGPQLALYNLSGVELSLIKNAILIKGNYNQLLSFPFTLTLTPRIKNNQLELAIEGISLFGFNLPTFLAGFLNKLNLNAKTQGLLSLTAENCLLVNHRVLPHLTEFNLAAIEVTSSALRIVG